MAGDRQVANSRANRLFMHSFGHLQWLWLLHDFHGQQESTGADGGGAQGACDENEEDGGWDGASLWNEGEGEEAEAEGFGGWGEF